MAKFCLFLLFIGLVSCATAFNDIVECGPTDTVCKCNPNATSCSFQFYVEYIFTFTKYNASISYADGQGERFYIDQNGNFVSLTNAGRCMDGNFVKQNGNDLYCNEERVCLEKRKLCTDLLSVDGKTFKTVIGVNKQFPGPNLVVTEGQTIAVTVHNNLSTEGITIHWHGQHLRKTNFMDGVGLVTQCPIQPGNSFRYIFKAEPSGTFWYHAHEGSQRARGLFGGLIIREKELKYSIPFIDDPASHTLTLTDFYRTQHEDFFRTLEFDIGQFPDLHPDEVPSDLNNAVRYFPTFGPDNSEIGINKFWSALINGKGRHSEVPYNRSRLSVFEVEPGQTYRFRLINVGSTYAYRFSINGHQLKVMSTDGYVVQPVEVDYILINTGERYDFLLEANQDIGDYGIKAETLEVKINRDAPAPFDFYDHKTEAILHYSTSSPYPTSSDYENILNPQRNCTADKPCKMLNCIFEHFHPLYNIECINVDSLRLFSPTPAAEMPDTNPDVTLFANLGGFSGPFKPLNSINDIHFVLPQSPLTTHYDKNSDSTFCDYNSTCNERSGCFCTTVMDIGDNVTVRLVLSTVGEERVLGHPIHIHGHSVHVVKIGYGQYSNTSGALVSSSRDLTCTEDSNDIDTLDQIRCPNPRFRSPNQNFQLDRLTVRKDTFIIPSGGYTVLQFRSDNPGYWLLHCHRHLHQRQGMALIIKEAVDKINPPPKELETCTTFLWEIDDFVATIEDRSEGMRLFIPNTLTIALFVVFGSYFT